MGENSKAEEAKPRANQSPRRNGAAPCTRFGAQRWGRSGWRFKEGRDRDAQADRHVRQLGRLVLGRHIRAQPQMCRHCKGYVAVEFVHYGNESGEKWARNVCVYVKLGSSENGSAL